MSHEGVFTLRLIGNVAIHTAVPTNTRHPTMSNAVRVPGLFNLVLMPAKNRETAKRTTAST